MTTKCDRCPVADGRCVGELAESEGVYLWACPAAAKGELLAEIRTASGAGSPEPKSDAPPESPQPSPARPRRDPARALATLRDSLRARKLGGLNCLYATAPGCGCSGMARCHARGRDVSLRDCVECLAANPAAR